MLENINISEKSTYRVREDVPPSQKLTAIETNEIVDKSNAAIDQINKNSESIDNLEENQYSGVVVYSTYLELAADTLAEKVSYRVTNDPDTTLINPPKSNNGYYSYDGVDIIRGEDSANGLVEEGDVEAVSGDTVFTYSKMHDNVYNVTILQPLESGYYTSATAKNAVPEAYRKNGIIISYELFSGATVLEQFTGTSAEWTNIDSWKITSTNFIEEEFILDELSMSSLFTTEAKQVLGGITNNGEFYLKFLLSQIATLGNLKFSSQTNNELLVIEDFMQKVAAYVDVDGNFNVQQLNAKNINLQIDELNRKVTSLLAVTSQLNNQANNGNQAIQDRENINVLKTKGTFIKDGDISTPKIYITMTDDDSLDYYQRTPTAEAPYPGGFYSRLFPVFNKKNIPGNIAYIISNWEGTSVQAYNEARYLQDVHGWEVLAHSRNHDYPAFNSDDVVEKYLKHSGTIEITDMDEAEAYLKEQWGRQQFLDLGFNVNNACVFGGGKTSARIRRIQKAEGYKCALSNDGFSKNKVMNVPPLAQFGVYRDQIMETYGNGTVTDYLKAGTDDLGQKLNDCKQKIDDMVAAGTGGWLDIITHAMYTHYANYNPDYDTVDYPDSWRVPVAVQTAPGSYTDPGIPDDWEPAPNTALKMIWDFIDYAKSQGVEFVTVNQAVSYWGNVINVGDFTWSQRKAAFDPYKSPHYVVGMNGSSNYYNF